MQQVLRTIADSIGLGDTIQLCRRWGGRELRVPVKVEAGDPLALTLGLEPAQRLVKAFGGERLQLPVERNALLDLRNAEIWRRCEENDEAPQTVALDFGLTRQGVMFVLAKMRQERAPA